MNHKRLHTRLLALLLCCALVLPLSACGEDKSTTQQIFAMDTVMDLTAYGKKADDGISAAISIINSMDTLLDPENERSKTYEINHAMGGSVVVNEQIAKMLRTAQTVYERSDGALDLTTYPLSKLWGFIDQNYRVPSDAEIERLLPCVAKFVTLYIGKGKKDKINRIDIVGFLSKKGGLNREDVGRIDVKDHYAFAAVSRVKVKQMLKMIQNEKIKGVKALIELAK